MQVLAVVGFINRARNVCVPSELFTNSQKPKSQRVGRLNHHHPTPTDRRRASGLCCRVWTACATPLALPKLPQSRSSRPGLSSREGKGVSAGVVNPVKVTPFDPFFWGIPLANTKPKGGGGVKAERAYPGRTRPGAENYGRSHSELWSSPKLRLESVCACFLPAGSRNWLDDDD